MKLIKLHVYESGKEVALNVEAISQVGTLEGAHVAPHGYIKRIDGGSVETTESYQKVIEMLEK